MERLKKQLQDHLNISDPVIQILDYGSYINIASKNHVFIRKVNQLPNKIAIKLTKLLNTNKKIIL